MKIKSIYIDGLHNAINKTYQLNDLVYLYGRNGAGKTTVLNAIQLALLGYIPGTAKNSKEALLRHSPKDSILVRIELCDIEGTTESVHIERIIGKNGSKLNILPSNFDLNSVIKNLELPIFNFNEFIGQTANKLKDYFIKNILPTTDGTLNWEQILAESILDCNFSDRNAIIEYGMSFIDTSADSLLDQVVQTNANLKEEQSFNKSELQRLQNTIDSLIYYEDYTGSTNIEELTSEILKLGSLRDQLLKYESAVAAIQTAKTELEKLETHLSELGGESWYAENLTLLDQLKKEQETFLTKASQKKDDYAKLNADADNLIKIINGAGCCPYTNAHCDTMSTRLDEFKHDLETNKIISANVHKELEAIDEELQIHRDAISRLEPMIRDYQATQSRITTITASLGNLPQKPDTDKSLTEIDFEISKLTESKTKAQANLQYNETIDKITKLKYDAELHSQALACWVKKTDTNGLQTTLMMQPFEELATTMTGYIQNMYGDNTLKAHFNVSTKANSFSFGLIRGDVYIPYDQLSAGEQCLYTLALMICITDSDKSPLKLILVDNSLDNLDDIAVENTFAALKNIKHIQFIMAGVKSCKNAEDVMIRI